MYYLDISEWTVKERGIDPEHGPVERDVVYPALANLAQWLMLPVWKDGMECCEAYDLKKRLEQCLLEDDTLSDADVDCMLHLSDREMELIRKVVNKLIGVTPNPKEGIMPLGGELHAELISRVFRARQTGEK